MTIDESQLDELLRGLPASPLSESTCARALALAHAQMASAPDPASLVLARRMLAGAVPAALVSADLVFLLDACAKMGRGFGG
jgi:hypothetical protein